MPALQPFCRPSPAGSAPPSRPSRSPARSRSRPPTSRARSSSRACCRPAPCSGPSSHGRAARPGLPDRARGGSAVRPVRTSRPLDGRPSTCAAGPRKQRLPGSARSPPSVDPFSITSYLATRFTSTHEAAAPEHQLLALLEADPPASLGFQLLVEDLHQAAGQAAREQVAAPFGFSRSSREMQGPLGSRSRPSPPARPPRPAPSGAASPPPADRPSANCALARVAALCLVPESRRLSSMFSCARLAMVSSSELTFAPISAFIPTSSL